MRSVIEITNIDAPELDAYARLTERQLLGRDEKATPVFIAESPNVILRALDAGYTPVSLLMERRHIDGAAREVVARCGDVPLYTAELGVLTRLTGYPLTRGVLCAMKRKALPDARTVCRGAKTVAVLENVMNPTNVGAVFRSAAALNVDAVLLTDSCCDPLYRRSVRVSMGTVFQVPWAFLPPDWTVLLGDMGFTTAALALRQDAWTVDDPRLEKIERLAVVLGAEGDGLREETVASCDLTVRIPMSHGVDSLNVAAAGAVAFWQLGRRDPSHREA